MGRLRPGIVKKLMRSVDSSNFVTPIGWDVISRYRSEELKLRYPPPKTLHPPEDKLYSRVFKQFPEGKMQPVTLNSATPSLVRQFVDDQVLHMNRGMTEEEAYEAARQRHQPQLEALGQAKGTANFVSLKQREEEEQLEEAVRKLYISQAEAKAE